jgi:TonB family protein
MKNTILLVAIFLLAGLCLNAQTVTDPKDTETLRKKNLEVVELFKQQEYKKAEKAALEALELSIGIFGENHTETATQYRNLGEIYRMRKKYDEAVEAYDKAIGIYELDPSENIEKLLDILNSKGTVLAFDGKKDKAKEIYAQYLSRAEAVYGADTKELVPHLEKVINYYLFAKDFDEADRYYIRREIVKIKTGESKRTGPNEFQDSIACFLHQNLSPKELAERQSKISEALAEYREKNVSSGGIKRVSGGVVNGKVRGLPKPEYPESARSKGIKGIVLVRLVIGRDGNIISAEGVCGHPLLQAAAVEAAEKASFEPTLLAGEPVEVSGYIVYNFN